MYFWYPFLEPHLTTYHSNIGALLKLVTKLGTSTFESIVQNFTNNGGVQLSLLKQPTHGSLPLVCAAVNWPIDVGHTNFLEPTLFLTMRNKVGHINVQPTLNF